MAMSKLAWEGFPVLNESCGKQDNLPKGPFKKKIGQLQQLYSNSTLNWSFVNSSTSVLVRLATGYQYQPKMQIQCSLEIFQDYTKLTMVKVMNKYSYVLYYLT